MNVTTLNKFSRYTIFGLSLFAMSLVVGATILALLGVLHPNEDGDEGVLAHLFQLAVALLLPSGLIYLVSADWQRPWPVIKALLLPFLFLLVAFVTLYYMEHRVA